MESRSPCLPIPAGVRFQVCLPTPMASGYMYVSPKALARYLPAYKRALLAAIPHADLSIQWDVCQEVLIFENYFPWRTPAYKTEIADELARLGRRLDFLHLPVPKDRSDTAYFAPLAGLKPSTVYYYRVAGGAQEFNFTSAPVTGAAYPYKIGFFADIGESLNADVTVQRMIEGSASIDSYVLNGDISYASGCESKGCTVWDAYCRMASPLASSVPWQVSE